VLAVAGCTARDLRAAASMVDLARQLTGLPHPPTALTPARILHSENFIFLPEEEYSQWHSQLRS
jgi:hypothetical protein